MDLPFLQWSWHEAYLGLEKESISIENSQAPFISIQLSSSTPQFVKQKWMLLFEVEDVSFYIFYAILHFTILFSKDSLQKLWVVILVVCSQVPMFPNVFLKLEKPFWWSSSSQWAVPYRYTSLSSIIISLIIISKLPNKFFSFSIWKLNIE